MSTYVVTLKPGLRVTHSHDFLLTSIATMVQFCTVSEINDDFSRKSQNFSPSCILCSAEGFPLELGTGTKGQKTRVMGYRAEKKSFSDLEDTMH